MMFRFFVSVSVYTWVTQLKPFIFAVVLPPTCKGECDADKLLKMDEQLNNKLGSETTTTDNNLDKSTGGISVEVCYYMQIVF